MKAKVQKKPTVEEDDTPQLNNLYCTHEIGKILRSQTLEELSRLGLKEDVVVSYTKIILMLLLSGIGTYSALCTSVEKSRDKLQMTVIAFFIVFCIMMVYDRGMLQGASLRLYVNDTVKIYLWCDVNWRNATYEIVYACSNNLSAVETYEVPLGEAFFEDGKLDEEWYRGSMAKLFKEINAMHMKKAT